MYTPPNPRGPSAFDAFTAAQSLADHTPGGVRVFQRFASQNLPPSPQPKAEKGFTCTREISPTLEVCVTRPPAPSPQAVAIGELLLTSKRNRAILLLDVYKRPRHSPGHARSDGVADARNHGAATRVRAGQTHPADLRPCARSQPGDALSGAPALGAARLDRIALGYQRGQSQGQILPTAIGELLLTSKRNRVIL